MGGVQSQIFDQGTAGFFRQHIANCGLEACAQVGAVLAGQAALIIDHLITGAQQGIVQNDYADGLMGGPDFWSVVANSGLNLRSDPSQSATKVSVLNADDVVRNLGCRMAEAQRWCQVQTITEPGLTGWVAGRFLAEAAEPAH